VTLSRRTLQGHFTQSIRYRHKIGGNSELATSGPVNSSEKEMFSVFRKRKLYMQCIQVSFRSFLYNFNSLLNSQTNVLTYLLTYLLTVVSDSLSGNPHGRKPPRATLIRCGLNPKSTRYSGDDRLTPECASVTDEHWLLQHDDGECVSRRLDRSAEEEVDVLVASESRRTQWQTEIDHASREPFHQSAHRDPSPSWTRKPSQCSDRADYFGNSFLPVSTVNADVWL